MPTVKSIVAGVVDQVGQLKEFLDTGQEEEEEEVGCRMRMRSVKEWNCLTLLS